jgi:glyoxylate carboligase
VDQALPNAAHRHRNGLTWIQFQWWCISGQVPTHAIGEDAFQECDAIGITRPCVKHNFLVRDVKDLAATFA